MENKDNLLKEKTKEQMEFDYSHFGYLLEETEQLANEIFDEKERREIMMAASKKVGAFPIKSPQRPEKNTEFGTPSEKRRKNWYDC